MSKVTVIYGSTTGVTETIAQKIAAYFSCEAINITSAAPDSLAADLIILGTSTWGFGELQDDWAGAGSALLEQSNLSGKKVAVFGVGDSVTFADTFCDGIAILVELAQAKGATNIGAFPASEYAASITSRVISGEQLLGLPLDETNEPEQTTPRLEKWLAQLKASL